jgi:hypothetical protein
VISWPWPESVEDVMSVEGVLGLKVCDGGEGVVRTYQ